MALCIKRPVNPRYVARVRLRGCRRYQVLGTYRTQTTAARAMLRAFMESTDYKRGDVLLTEDWYEPHRLLEVVR